MLAELLSGAQLGGDGFDPLDLAFGDDVEDVARPLLDEGHEASVAQRAVGTAEGEGVGKRGDPDAEVGRHARSGVPELVEGLVVGDEGEAGEPGGVEACCADYCVDVVRVSFVVHEPGLGDGANGVGEDGSIRCDESFEISWCWSWASTAGIEILWDHLLDKAWVVVEFLAHVAVGVFACQTRLVASFNDELEALIEFVLDLFPILEVFLRIVFQELQLFVAV